ncbi:MAG TPA: murein L,D-transpeptidase catalytic domain family protein [Gemmatimonadales bacterium]|nr:murein L,D-transpeptidase catalytic domain family protein [Gemmatimonadales bacterium]
MKFVFRSLAALTSLVLALPALGAAGGSYPAPATSTAEVPVAKAAANPHDELISAATAAGLESNVLDLALAARERAVTAGLTSSPILTVIDYSRPSHERRLWVLNVADGTVLAHEFVAHGRGSGNDVATRFSNRPGSNATSLGTFITGDTYQGKHGLSLRLRGLDDGLNDNALARAIVVHGAWYVSPAMIAQYGRLGRSEGCPALAPDVAPRIIDLIRGHTVVFAYYPSDALTATLASR